MAREGVRRRHDVGGWSNCWFTLRSLAPQPKKEGNQMGDNNHGNHWNDPEFHQIMHARTHDARLDQQPLTQEALLFQGNTACNQS